MSMWTHITSCMSVETGIEDDEVIEIVKKYLETAPKITGSEHDADVFVNVPSGYNVGNYQTCVVISVQGDLRDRTLKETRDEFYTFLKYIKERYFIRDYSLNIID